MDSLDPAVPKVDPPISQPPQPSHEPAGISQVSGEKPLIYEETPVIDPVEPVAPSTGPVIPPLQPEPPPPPPAYVQPLPPQQPVSTSIPRPGFSFFGLIKNVLLIIILFGLGIGLSMFLKQYLPSGITSLPSFPLKNSITPTPLALVTPTAGLNPFANWKSYPVTSGLGKQEVSGITFMLPTDILAPICDGGNCASSGTYLPGGTRFTVDARGVGQLLPDYRGKILTDQGGRGFSMKDATVAGRPAKEFSGIFTGTTSGGYAFSRMRGVMVEVTDTLSVEFNHFTPTLVNADFTADDVLFDKILQSVQISLPLPTIKTNPSATPTASVVVPSVTPTP